MTSTKTTTGPLTTPTHTPEQPSEPVSGVRAVVTGAEALEQEALREALEQESLREALEREALDHEALVSGTGGLSSVSQGHVAGASAEVGISSSTATAGVQAVNLVDLAKAVEAGQLTMGQAVEKLVEGTVGSLPRQLTDLERSELSELLRSAVSSDPTLSALQDDSA